MRNLVTASIEVDAPREQVLAYMLDPDHLGEWVSIHRKVNSSDDGRPREGFCMEQTLCIRHANFRVKWTLTEYAPPERATWEGRGPAGSHARTSYLLREAGKDRTSISYENEFTAPGGFLGKAASRALMGGVPEREANRTLEALRERFALQR